MKTAYCLLLFIIFTIKICLYVPDNIPGKLKNVCNRLSIIDHVFSFISHYLSFILFFEFLFSSESLV
jgi:hypothetical protein